MFCFLWHVEQRSVLSPMSTGLWHTHCIVTMCQLVNLLWVQCFNPVIVWDLQRRYQCKVTIFIWNIWHLWNHLISVHYANWHSLFVLEIDLFESFSFDAKALRSITLPFWLPNLNRSLQSILIGSVDTDIRKWLVHAIS